MVGERHVVGGDLLAALFDAEAVVLGPERSAVLRGGVEAHPGGGEGGQLKRQHGLLDIVPGRGGDVQLLVKQLVAACQQVDLAGRGVRDDPDVVVGDQHRIEIDESRGGREVEGVDFPRFIDRVDHGFDLVLRIAVDEGVARQCGRRVALVVRRARRNQAAACSYDTEQYAQ